MTEQSELAGRLKELLRLDLEPVGVRVFGREEALPDQVAGLEPEAGVKSYCQALVKAARGEALCAGKSKLGCVLGTSTLGLEDDPEPLLDDTVREKYGAGLFESEEASRKSIEAALKFAPGANQAVLVGPLATMPAEAQLIILEIDPEQTMWLLYAANYQKGGAQDLPQSGGVAGGLRGRDHLSSVQGRVQHHFSRPGLPDQIGHSPRSSADGPAGRSARSVGRAPGKHGQTHGHAGQGPGSRGRLMDAGGPE